MQSNERTSKFIEKVIDNSGNKEYYSVADVKGDVKKDISYSGK